MTEFIINSLSVLTLVSNVFLALFLLVFVLQRYNKTLKTYWKSIRIFFSKRAILNAFIVALVATSGSLYFSEGAGFTPCKLCWLQRIFMYPLVVIFGVALWKKAHDVAKYSLPLSFAGLLIAIYHYYLQVSHNPFAPCSTIGFSVSCTESFFTYFGYITIPWMSLSAFALISLYMLLESGKLK